MYCFLFSITKCQEWVLKMNIINCVNTKSAVFQLYHDENTLLLDEMIMMCIWYYINTLTLISMLLGFVKQQFFLYCFFIRKTSNYMFVFHFVLSFQWSNLSTLICPNNHNLYCIIFNMGEQHCYLV
jgi:hypothetical protein